MNRVRIVLVVVMSLLAGGVVFKIGSGQADPGDRDPWAQPPPPVPPPGAPGKPPKPPKPPKSPKPPKTGISVGGGGLSISIRNNKVHIEGLDQLVAGHLDNVRHLLANNPNIPKDVRDKIVGRMDRVKAIVDKTIKNLDTGDLDKLEEQLEKMGNELEKAMEGLDADLSKLGDRLAKDIAKNIGKDMFKDLAKSKLKFGPDPADVPSPPDHDDNDDDKHDNDSDHDDHDNPVDDDDLSNHSVDASDDDLRAAVDHLKNFALKPAQKDAIAKLRAETDARVANEKRALDDASKRLEAALADIKTSDADIARAVDKISQHEAAIRKARLLSWVHARRVLDADQVKQLEDAAGKTR